MSLLKYESQVRAPLVDGNKNYHQVTEDIIRPIEAKPSRLMVDWFSDFCRIACYLVFIPFTVRLLMVLVSGT